MARELDRLPSVVLVDRVPVQHQEDTGPVRDRVGIPCHRRVALQADMMAGIHRQIYRPSVDMERTEHILQARVEHSCLTRSVSSNLRHLKFLPDDVFQFQLVGAEEPHWHMTNRYVNF